MFRVQLFIRQDKRQDRDIRLWLCATCTHSMLNSTALHRDRQKEIKSGVKKQRDDWSGTKGNPSKFYSTEANLFFVGAVHTQKRAHCFAADF